MILSPYIESLDVSLTAVIPDERSSSFGYCVGEGSDMFSISDWNNPGINIASFDESNITDFMQTKDGHVTGIIIIHICDGLEVKTDEQYKAG